MSAVQEEVPVTHRVQQRPSAEPGKLRGVSARALSYRFIAGGATSVVAGVVTLAFGTRVGGIFLAFPAILAASLTLIESEEDSAEAREDARGAIVGGCALAVFAAVAALTFGSIAAAVALGLATVAWFVAAFAGYGLAWFR